jgi:hypothetical protein
MMDSWDYLGKDEKKSGGWASQLQGLTHDDANWYFFQEGCIIELSGPPYSETGTKNRMHISHIKNETGKQNYFHIGNGKFTTHNGNRTILAPVEYNGSAATLVALVSLDERYAADGEYVFKKNASGLLAKPSNSGLTLTKNHKGSWCTVNPLDGLMYSSDFDDVDHLWVYNHKVIVVHSMHPLLTNQTAIAEMAKYGISVAIVPKSYADNELWDWSEEIGVGLYQYVGNFYLFDYADGAFLPYKLNSVQGGCYSASGQLFLTSDSKKGIHGFCGISGRSWGWVEKNGREVEGITIWDRSAINKGTIHVAYLEDNVQTDDDADIKHWRVPMGSGI